MKPITAASPSKARNIFAQSSTGIVGSDFIKGIYSVFVFSCVGSSLATGSSPVQRVILTVYKIPISALI
jgi:hypothetical protein